MNNEVAKFGSIYFGIFGIITLIFGVLEFAAIGMGGISWGLLDISGMFLPWRAIILVAAGVMYLSSISDFGDTRQLAKSLAASIMIWIIAGMWVWAGIAGSIPGGEEGGWFIPPGEELVEVWGAMPPAVFLGLFVLAIFYPIRSKREVAAG